MLDYLLIRLLTKDKLNNDKYHKILTKLTLEKEIHLLIRLIGNYYSRYPEHTYVSQSELTAFYDLEYPQSKQRPEIMQIVQGVYATDTSDSLAVDVLKSLIQRDAVTKIINTTLPFLSGEPAPTISSIKEILEESEELADSQTDASSTPFIDDTLDELISKTESDGLSWRLTCLKECLGPLSGGTLGHVFARPESGKTTFLHSEVAYMASQLSAEETILWINNEEAGSRVKLRLYSAVCNASLADIISNRDKAGQVFNERGGQRIYLYDAATISIAEIERLCNTYRPRLVVIDQGDKVTYKGSESAGNGADRLKGVYDGLREVVKRCNSEWKCDFLTVGQADAPAEGQKWLFMSNLDSGKTGKAGAFDYIIGIGKSREESDENLRYISFCKNKLRGLPGRFVVGIDAARARYHDI